MTTRLSFLRLAALAMLVIVSGACRQDMHDAPKYEPLEASDFFADGQASRQPVANTVARGMLMDDEELYQGVDLAGQPLDRLPESMGDLSVQMLKRGQQRFNIFCSPCHGQTGDGNGMIVRRGYKQPESFHTDRLRDMPVGYFFDVITNGFGQMPKYASQVKVEDRWAIAAYVQALQLSRNAPLAALTAEDQQRLASAGQESGDHHDGGAHGGDHEGASAH